MKSNSYKTPQYYLDRIDSKKISFARELRGFTKKELAEKINKSASAITQIEKGSLNPDLQTFAEIALALSVPPAFLSSAVWLTTDIDLNECHFRARRDVSQAMRRQSIRFSSLLVDLLSMFEEFGIQVPKEDISKNMSYFRDRIQIEEYAMQLRELWDIGMGPIDDLTFLLESRGVLIVCLLNCNNKVDAFSVWISKRPCIMLDFDGKPASRLNFDLAHELGHLLLHEDILTGDITTERQANFFASSFLAPAESFSEECPRKWNYSAFLDLKRRWKISMQACLYRARELGILSESNFRTGMIFLSKHGQRIKEEGEFEKNEPILISQSLDVLLGEHNVNININILSERLGLHPPELEQILRSQQVPESIILRLKLVKPLDRSKLIMINNAQT